MYCHANGTGRMVCRMGRMIADSSRTFQKPRSRKEDKSENRFDFDSLLASLMESAILSVNAL